MKWKKSEIKITKQNLYTYYITYTFSSVSIFYGPFKLYLWREVQLKRLWLYNCWQTICGIDISIIYLKKWMSVYERNATLSTKFGTSCMSVDWAGNWWIALSRSSPCGFDAPFNRSRKCDCEIHFHFQSIMSIDVNARVEIIFYKWELFDDARRVHSFTHFCLPFFWDWYCAFIEGAICGQISKLIWNSILFIRFGKLDALS